MNSNRREYPNSLRSFMEGMPLLEQTPSQAISAIARDYARRYAGPPAHGRSRVEPAVRYHVDGCPLPVIIGCYGDETRVRQTLPALPEKLTAAAVHHLLSQALPARYIENNELPSAFRDMHDLNSLPILTHTPRDAGAYITQGFIYADTEDTVAFSAHRLWRLGGRQVAVSILPGRQLAQAHQQSLARGKPLSVSINIGIPPAAAIAASLSGKNIPSSLSKLSIAGALAGSQIRLASCHDSEAHYLADSEIVLEGTLGPEVADESTVARYSMPEFLGYSGKAATHLVIFNLSSIRVRQNAFYPALIGPGREQSVQLGLAGALNALLALPEKLACGIADLRYSHAGGGMLLLYVALFAGFNSNEQLQALSETLIEVNPFTKMVIFVDGDINLQADEDVLWALVTRCRLEQDMHCLTRFPPLPMDPSQSGNSWRNAPEKTARRIWINATIPTGLQDNFQRAYKELV